MTRDDDQLTARLAAGRADAFAEVYDHYGRALYAYLLGLTRRSADAEDLLQEVMLRLVRSRARLSRVTNLRAYLYTVARNEWIRKRPRVAESFSDVLPESAVPVPRDDDEVRTALRRLAPERAEVVSLKLRHALSFAQIGEVLAISPNTAASRYRYALRDLARILETTDVRR